jgi:hypothetical protein
MYISTFVVWTNCIFGSVMLGWHPSGKRLFLMFEPKRSVAVHWAVSLATTKYLPENEHQEWGSLKMSPQV